MRTVPASDLRPGMRRQSIVTCEEVTHLPGNMVRIRWSDGSEQTVQAASQHQVMADG